MSRPNTYKLTIINKLHDQWCKDNGYKPKATSVKPKPQASSGKPQAPSKKSQA